MSLFNFLPPFLPSFQIIFLSPVFLYFNHPSSLLSLPLSFFPSHSSIHPSKVKVLVTQSCPTLCDPMNCSLPGSSVHGILQVRIWSRGYSLLQWIFLTRGLNPGLLHCRWILYCMSHQGSPKKHEKYKTFFSG